VLLAVTKIDPFSKIMAKKLTHAGRKVYVSAELPAFRKAVEEYNPDVVVLDGVAEFGPELRLWLKGRQQQQLTSLVVFYPEEADPQSREGFRVLEDSHVIEPYDIEELSGVIDAEIERLRAERKYFLHTVKFQAQSQVAYVQEAGVFLENLAKNSGLEEDDYLALVNAAREALDNGARHGNKSDPSKIVAVEYVLDPEKVTITVRDEGPGFDTSSHLGDGIDGDAVAVARKRHQEGKVGGLGIMLMLRCVDRLEYNTKGNEVKLTKKLGAKAAVA